MKNRKAQLRVGQLRAEQLKKVQGGRGTYCGDDYHCECGASLSANAAASLGMCPFCWSGFSV